MTLEAIEESKVTSVDPSLSDAEKNILRAERFGIPLQLSLQEMRYARLLRFDTSLYASESNKLKRKTRPESFISQGNHHAYVEIPVEAIEESKVTLADPSLSDAEMNILRAERFGIPRQLSLQEMRYARLLRFDTSLYASKSNKLKRKTRPESFGMPINPSLAADDESNKKAQLATFVLASNIDHVWKKIKEKQEH